MAGFPAFDDGMADEEAGADEDAISSLDDGGVGLADVSVLSADVIILAGMVVVSLGVMTSLVSQVFGLCSVSSAGFGLSGIGEVGCMVGVVCCGGGGPSFVGSAGFGLSGLGDMGGLVYSSGGRTGLPCEVGGGQADGS